MSYAGKIEELIAERDALRQENERLSQGWSEANQEILTKDLANAELRKAHCDPVAWLWHHIDNETGLKFDRGLSFSKVEPTNDTFMDGRVSTTVQALIVKDGA